MEPTWMTAPFVFVAAYRRSSRPGRIKGYRLRFNLDGRPKGKAAPANLHPDPGAEVWGVLYRITRRDLLRLDSTEGVPGRGYRHVEIEAEDGNGRVVQAVTTWLRVMRWMESRRCGTSPLLRDGARAHGLPETHIQFLEGVDHVQ
jgi:gamma-glutamylcyclotransferase